MRQQDILEGVPVFVAVAEAGSFSAAGRRLGISPSAVSQAVRGLEERIGTPLFRRSTRSLSLTDVGMEYWRSAAPALAQLRQAAEIAAGQAGRPAGPLRLTMPRAPFELLLAPMLVAFQDAYPDIELEIAVEARLVDIVKQGYDAGLRFGRYLDKDMVAVEVAPKSEAALVAAPEYLRARGQPATPRDLLDHRVIMCRSQGSGLVIPWTLQSAGETLEVAPPLATIVHDLSSQIALSIHGLGIASAPTAMVSRHLQTAKLVHVLPEWSCPLDAVYLYFPSRRHRSAALAALIAFLSRRP
ncbi:LysR family transcriptional regulator [Sphingomonas sp.]|uniref:LysR family transcriptional regulator n=1 Tax=Sphingomonas sp. TaxID=28214 RepID=UPI003B3B28A0